MKTQNKYVASILVDIPHFYDSIEFTTLVDGALRSNFPPLPLQMALGPYRGDRFLTAEGLTSDSICAQKVILAGCPIAPALAEVVIAPLIQKFMSQVAPMVVDVWVDDVSVDLVSDNPEKLAAQTVEAFRLLKAIFKEPGLELSPHKSGFVVSHASVGRHIRRLVSDSDPEVHTVLKDLGVDSTGCRLRQIPTQRAKQTKAVRRSKQLSSLRQRQLACLNVAWS